MERSAFGQQEGGKLLDEGFFFLILCFTRLTEALGKLTFPDAASLTSDRRSLQSANR